MTMIRFLTCVLAIGVSTAAALAAQDRLPSADLPGVYRAGQCHEAPFPVRLPAVDSVVDSASLAATLPAIGVTKRIVLQLRPAASDSVPRVRVLEKRVSDQIADSSARLVEAALRTAAPNSNWIFRLLIEKDHPLTTRLERSRVCAATPGPKNPEVQTVRMQTDSAADSRRAFESEAARRRTILYRVLVDRYGQLAIIQLVHSSGDRGMDEQVAAAIRERAFTPTTLDGVTVSAWVEVRGDQ
jgi:TonB family protein